jgi:hypothetical protein
MSTALSPRVPTLEWSHRAAAGELEKLEWVDTRLDPSLTAMSHSMGEAKSHRFRHMPYLRQVPPVIAQAAVSAQAQGRVSAWEGLQLLFARVEWTIRGRRYLWSPFSPVPRLLASLVEAYGVEAGIHRFDGDRLARLTALLPVWHPFRGTVSRAREVLAACDMEAELAGAVSSDGDAGGAEAPNIADEVFACHRLDWWTHRSSPGCRPEYRITGNFLRFQPEAGGGFALRREDVLIHWQPGRPLPREAIRLLPAWMVIRLAAPTGRT